MPLALAIAGIGGTLAGTGMQIAGNIKSQRAIDSTRGQFQNAENNLANQSMAIHDATLGTSTAADAEKQIASGAANRENIWTKLNTGAQPAQTALPVTTKTGTTGAAGQRDTAAAGQWGKIDSRNKAAAGGYGDWETQQAIKLSEAGRQIDKNALFARENAQLLPTEMNVAYQSGDRLRGWGQIATSLGNMAMMSSMFSGFGGSGGAAPAANNAAAHNEFMGMGAPGMTGSPVSSSGGVIGGFDTIPTVPLA